MIRLEIWERGRWRLIAVVKDAHEDALGAAVTILRGLAILTETECRISEYDGVSWVPTLCITRAGKPLSLSRIGDAGGA